MYQILIDNGLDPKKLNGKIKLDIGLSYSAPQSQDWLSKEKDITVIGFEPNPDAVGTIIKGDIQKRHKDHGTPIQKKYLNDRFFLIPIGLSNTNGDMDFYITQRDCGCSSLFQPKEDMVGPVSNKITVPVFTLSSFFELINHIPFVEYIKIDAQGSDLNILKGAGNFLQEKVIYVTAEGDGFQYKGADSCSEKEITSYMASQGFEKIKHPNTVDPTYINIKYKDIARSIYISQTS